MRETEGKSHKNLNIACHVGSNDDVNKEVINSKPAISSLNIGLSAFQIMINGFTQNILCNFIDYHNKPT